MPLRPVLNTTEAAKALGVNEQTVRNLYHERKLEGYVVGRKIVIFEDAIQTYQNQHSNLGITPAVPVQEKPPMGPTRPLPRSTRRCQIWERHR